MRIKKFLTGLVLATLLSWVCLIAILNYTDPQDQNSLVFGFFYLFLFSSLGGSLLLIDFLVRRLAHKKKDAFKQLKISLRQAIILALILTIALYLQSQGQLFWGPLFVLIIAAVLLEWLLGKLKYVN